MKSRDENTRDEKSRDGVTNGALSGEREAQIRAIRARVHALMPELLPEIRRLVEMGLIDGWRNVRACEKGHSLPELTGAVRGPFLTGREFTEGT